MGQVSHAYDGTTVHKVGRHCRTMIHIFPTFDVARGIKLMLEASADDYFNLQATHWRNTSSCHGSSVTDDDFESLSINGAQCYDGSTSIETPTLWWACL
jgi:hypothetical protein